MGHSPLASRKHDEAQSPGASKYAIWPAKTKHCEAQCFGRCASVSASFVAVCFGLTTLRTDLFMPT
jgi:hypothetical protein